MREPAEPRSVAIVGAGAIGAWLADALDRAQWRVSLVARGATLAALRTDGLWVERNGRAGRCSHPRSGAAAELGVHDYVVLAVKAQALPALASGLQPLIGPSTAVISATNGIPWWFFQDFPGPLANQVLHAVDPHGGQARVFGGGGALGMVVHASVRTLAPARARVVAADRLLLGEPGGASTPPVREMVEALRAGGVNAEVSGRIRAEVWAKLWGNMNMNPLSALTRSGTGRLAAEPDVRALCLRMMEEMQRCGDILGLDVAMTAVERMEVTARLGDFRTSMLADLEAGRPLELEPQLGAVVEIAGRLGEPAPFCRAVLGLARLLSTGGAAAAVAGRAVM